MNIGVVFSLGLLWTYVYMFLCRHSLHKFGYVPQNVFAVLYVLAT